MLWTVFEARGAETAAGNIGWTKLKRQDSNRRKGNAGKEVVKQRGKIAQDVKLLKNRNDKDILRKLGYGSRP